MTSVAPQFLRRLGLGVFVAALGVLAWWWAARAARGGSGGGLGAVLVDTLLFSAFALHHSLLARRSAKVMVERLVGSDLVRTTYVWMASALLIAVCLLWQPVGELIYEASGGLALVLRAIQILGVVIGLLAVRRISLRQLAGLGGSGHRDELEVRFPYRLVRHPLYLGWVLVLFGATRMTGDRLLFAAISTVYLLVAMPFEETALLDQFGQRYREYRRAVRWRLIPYIH